MWRFLLFITFIILIQRLIKTLQEQQREQPEPTEDEIRNYFQSLGFPPPEEIPPKPKPEKPKEPVIVKKAIKEPGVEITELKPRRIEPSPKQIEKIEKKVSVFSTDKLEEGIILSEILGPPKAYRIRRSGEIGRRA